MASKYKFLQIKSNLEINNRIVPDEEVVLENGTKFELKGCVVYGNGHYIAYFKHDDLWYIYNDIEPDNRVMRIGNYDKLLSRRRYNPTTAGVLYFYHKNLIILDVIPYL